MLSKKTDTTRRYLGRTNFRQYRDLASCIGFTGWHKVILTMPASVTPERVKLAQSYGAEVILTPAEKGIPGAIEKAKQLQEQHHAYIPDQFNNPFNVLAHELTTGPEILKQTSWEVDAFVAGVGSGGTISGVGRALRRALGIE